MKTFSCKSLVDIYLMYWPSCCYCVA